MSALHVKLLRDTWRMGGQVLTIALVVACGIAGFVMSLATWRTLSGARDDYTAEFNLADIHATVVRAPMALARRLEELPGVTAVQVRVRLSIRLALDGFNEPVSALLTSLPPPGAYPVNALYLRSGRMVEPGDAREAVISDNFATAHGLLPGARVTAYINGRPVQLRIVGVGMSPEHIYVTPPGAILPDDRRFGVVWMDGDAVARAAGMDGTFNDVVITCAPDADVPALKERVAALLQPHGETGVTTRADFPSMRFISQELEQLRGMVTMFPLVFLGVAMFLLSVLLARVVGIQREQIAAMKALGYRSTEIGVHYAQFALVIVLAGVVVGLWLGVEGGKFFTAIYMDYFRFPRLDFRLHGDVVASAVALAVVAALVGAWSAVRQAVRLPPAEAMRPEAPPVYRRSTLERMGFHRLLSVQGRMVVRDIERRPARTLLSSLAIASAAAVLVASNMSFDSVSLVLDVQFRLVQHEDFSVVLQRPAPTDIVQRMRHVPGAWAAEGRRIVPVRLHHGPVRRDTAITGVPAGASLTSMLDARFRPIPLPPDGLVLSRALADRLGVGVGGRIAVEVLQGERRTIDVVVTGVVDDLFGMGGTMDLHALARLLREAPQVDVVLLSVDPRAVDAASKDLERYPGVLGVTRLARVQEEFKRRMDEVFLLFSAIIALCAAIIAVGVVYNNARIALAQRARDLGTLRVLGLGRREVSAVVLLEQVVQLVLGIPFGLWLGNVLTHLLASTIDPEMFRFPVAIQARTYAYAVLVVLVSAAASALLVRRRVDQMDLVGVLKARD